MYVWQNATCHTQTCFVWQDMITPHSGTGQAAYSELLRALRDDDEAGLKGGTPTLRKRGGKRYWYLRQRLGAKIRETYAGEDTPDLRAEMDQLNARSHALAARRRERSRIVRILRAEGYQGFGDDVGPLLAAMANAGAFRAGGVLVGTHAYRLYEGELGVRIPFDDAAMTMDVDLAARNARVELAVDGQDMVSAFEALDFEPIGDRMSGRVWRWRQGAGLTSIEFLTTVGRAGEGVVDLPALGVSAMALRYMDYLVEDAIPAAAIYRSGILVRIPRPERFAMHKLIVADRRRGGETAEKARKDRRQAAVLIEALARQRPEDLADAYEDARGHGKRWGQRIDASLKQMPETKDILEKLD